MPHLCRYEQQRDEIIFSSRDCIYIGDRRLEQRSELSQGLLLALDTEQLVLELGRRERCQDVRNKTFDLSHREFLIQLKEHTYQQCLCQR